MISIPLLTPVYGKEETDLVLKAMESGFLNEGKFCREFERLFAEYVGARYCHVVPNGRIALYMSLVLLEPRPIFIPTHYGIFAADAAREAGHMVIPVDVSQEGVLDVEGVDSVSVHANGRIATVSGNPAIEDSCQAISLHTPGAVSCYSFHSTKQMTLGGIGGAVCVDDRQQYEDLAAIKDHGRPERAMGKPVGDVHSFWGSNFKMSEINAAFGVAQLKGLPGKMKRLQEIYEAYVEIIGSRVQWFDGDPTWRVDCLVENAGVISERMKGAGVGAQQYYRPLHKQPGYERAGDMALPMAETLWQRGLYLPSTTTLTEDDIQKVCEALKSAIDIV